VVRAPRADLSRGSSEQEPVAWPDARPHVDWQAHRGKAGRLHAHVGESQETAVVIPMAVNGIDVERIERQDLQVRAQDRGSAPASKRTVLSSP